MPVVQLEQCVISRGNPAEPVAGAACVARGGQRWGQLTGALAAPSVPELPLTSAVRGRVCFGKDGCHPARCNEDLASRILSIREVNPEG